jgi:hypothetical protein
MNRKLFAALIPGLQFLCSPAAAQQGFFVKPLAEKKVTELPAGELFWHINTFEMKEQAQAAAGSFGLVAKYDGKVWLFMLSGAGEGAKGGTRVAEIGPIPGSRHRSICCGSTRPEGRRAVPRPRAHPGSEALYMLKGEVSQKTPHGVARLTAGQSMVGHERDTPMVVSNSGSEDLREFVLFVVDASRPFLSPAQLQ